MAISIKGADVYTPLRGQLCTLDLLVFTLGMLLDVVDLGLGTMLRSWAWLLMLMLSLLL